MSNTGHAIPVTPLVPNQQPPPPPPPLPPKVNLPNSRLLKGRRKRYMSIVVPLYEAAIKGDWKAARPILDREPELIRAAITDDSETLLHVAASAKSTKDVEDFVKNLVDLMNPQDLELQAKDFNTAFGLAAVAGNKNIMKIMEEKNPDLIEISGYSMPLYIAALYAKRDVVTYLYRKSNKMSGCYWNDENRGWVLQRCVEAEFFDVAIEIVEDLPRLLNQLRLLIKILTALARNTKAFKGKKTPIIGSKESKALQLFIIILEKIAHLPRNHIDIILKGPLMEATIKGEKTVGFFKRVLFIAAENGNTRFIVELIRLYPDLVLQRDDEGKTIFHLAIQHRQADVYNLLYELPITKEFIINMKDIQGNTLLHMAAMVANKNTLQDLSAVVLEIQQELLWFKEVKNMVPSKYMHKKNKLNETPQDLFNKKNADLKSKGEEWIDKYSLVATLIATVVFAAAFTLPGGYDQNTGFPFFLKKSSLIIFAISDAFSLIFSSASVVIFLSILTSRYSDINYMNSFPLKLLLGLLALFLSIVSMMVAFSSSFFVLYHKKLKWVPITVSCLASLPVLLFIYMQSTFLLNIISVTFRSRYLLKPTNQIYRQRHGSWYQAVRYFLLHRCRCTG